MFSLQSQKLHIKDLQLHFDMKSFQYQSQNGCTCSCYVTKGYARHLYHLLPQRLDTLTVFTIAGSPQISNNMIKAYEHSDFLLETGASTERVTM